VPKKEGFDGGANQTLRDRKFRQSKRGEDDLTNVLLQSDARGGLENVGHLRRAALNACDAIKSASVP